MKQKKKHVLIIAIILLTVAVAGLLFISNTKVLLIRDESFKMVLPKSQIRELRFALAKKGINLKILTLEDFTLEEVLANKSDIVIYSPVIASFLASYNTNVSEKFSDSITIALGSGAGEYFDAALISETENGFAQVPEGKIAIDYRYSLGHDDYDGVVCPDLEKSVLPLIKKTKDSLNHLEGLLVYEYKEK